MQVASGEPLIRRQRRELTQVASGEPPILAQRSELPLRRWPSRTPEPARARCIALLLRPRPGKMRAKAGRRGRAAHL